MLEKNYLGKERSMTSEASYDDIADWYEGEFVGRQQVQAGIELDSSDPLGIDHALRELLGEGDGVCLDIGCGTGINAALVRSLGWTPIGVDLSVGMLRYSRSRLPVIQANAEMLPIGDASVSAIIAMLVHTDMPAYPAVLCEAARVLRPGGVLVHVGVHPCFCGSFADRSDPAAILVRPGYLNRHRSTSSWTTRGLRSKVGATHWPLVDLLHAMLDADMTVERFVEGGRPTPVILAVRTRKVDDRGSG